MLKEIAIPNSVREIGWCAFYDCNAMQSIHLPDSLRILGPNAFPAKMQNIIVSSNSLNFTMIDGVLYNKEVTELVLYPQNSKIKSFVVPSTVEKIRFDAFRLCKKLTSIMLPSGLKEIGEASFENCSSLKTISLPDGIKIIPENAFRRCESLRKVKLPDELKAVANDAFILCDCLETVEIHIPYKNINNKVTWLLHQLNMFYQESENNSKLCKVIVPKGTKMKYEKWCYWVSFEEEKE